MRRFVRAQTLARLKKLGPALTRAARKPGDPESVHELRVAIRRFTECLRTFDGCFEGVKIKKIRRQLRRLMDHCGEARNFDIALDLIKEAGCASDHLVAELDSKRRRAEKQLAPRLKRWRKRDFVQRWKAGLRTTRVSPGVWDWKQTPESNCRRVLPELVAELFRAGDDAAALGTTHEAIHNFRLRTKRFRYALEVFQPLYGKKLDPVMKSLRGVQEKLGRINDCVTTLELIQANAAAVLALEQILEQRVEQFQRYWKRTFGKTVRRRWIALLGAAPVT